MNVDFQKYLDRQPVRPKWTEAQRLAFQKTAIFDAAKGRGDEREGAYPILSIKAAERHHVVDRLRQVLSMIRSDHPGPVWNDSPFVATVQAMLEQRVRELDIASQPKVPVQKQIGGRFAAQRQIADGDDSH